MDEENIIEDQLNEMEVLTSMYLDEIEVISEDPHIFTILISAKIDEEAAINRASVTMQFKFPKSYPHVFPIFEIVDCEDLDRPAEIDILEMIENLCEEYLGEVMIFNFITAIQEKIEQILDLQDTDRKMEVMRLEKKLFDEEQKKFEGQIVTIESFLEWRTAFNAEIEAKLKKNVTRDSKKESLMNSKLTGKELFSSDLALDDSDVKFLEDENDIEIDEALFDYIEDNDDNEENLSD